MSVLLEALKKAAENKKQVEGSHKNEGTSDVALEPKISELGAAQEKLLQSEVNPDSSIMQTDSSQGVGLTLSNTSAGSDGDVSVGGSISTEEVVRDNNQNTADTKAPSLGLTLDDTADSALRDYSIAEGEVAAVDTQNAGLISFEQLEVSEADSPKTTQPLEESGHVPATESALVTKPDSEDSYAWSLETLPGYQSDDKVSSSVDTVNAPETIYNETPNPILSTNQRFRHIKATGLVGILFGTSSGAVIYSLMTLLVLSVMGAVAVGYFYSQSEAIEKSMQKYAITKLPEAPVALATKQVSENQNDTAEGASESSHQPSPAAGEMGQEDTSEVKEAGVSSELTKDKPVVSAKAKTTSYVSPAKVIHPTVKREEVKLTIQAKEEISILQQAYDAMHVNDSERALVLFKQALSENPHSVNALNGTASIYAQIGDIQEAIKYYYSALEEDADNLYAYESVIRLTADQLSGEAWKDELKRAIGKHPKSAVLHYALGNLYAKENDWNMAQSEFFEAHSLDQKNPDYLVNLAISLDHLGEYALASEYYTNSLVFVKSGQVNFDEASIKARLANIKLFLEQNHL